MWGKATRVRRLRSLGKPAAKLGDEIVAKDTHLVIPVPLAKPEPLPPLPFKGIITTNLSKDVFIEGKPAATVGSGAANTTPHPPVPPPATYLKPPSNQGIILTGSTGVFINGKPAAKFGDTAITCNDPVDLPVGKVVASGKVFIGETGAAPVKSTVVDERTPKLVEAKFGQLGKIVNARWGKNRVKCGEKVKMIVDVKGFEDGTPARFVIWEEDIDGSNDFIEEKEAEVRGDRVEADWEYSPAKVKEDMKEDIKDLEGEPKYFFAVDIEGEEMRSGILTLTYPVDIYLSDEDGNPLDDVEYTIIFSDGTQKKGKFKEGYARIEDAPYGKFTLKVKDYDFVL